MKSLQEEIKQVKETRGANSEKVKSLIKLGLLEAEAKEFVRTWSAEKRVNAQPRFSYTFGVEIECYNAIRRELTDKFTSEGVRYNFEGYNHTDNKEYYKFVSDSSLRGNDTIECVSPVLGGKNGLKSLKACCNALNKAGVKVNKSCGMHVHIGAGKLTDEQYVNVFINYQKLERVIDTFMAESRRANNSQWCKSLQGKDFETCRTRNDVMYAMNGSRYYKVNALSYGRHKTIEFRQHQGSTDYEKISNWVNFCAKLVKFSMNTRLTREINSVDEIPFLTAKEKAFFSQRAAMLA